jgi:hypothetical protein
MNNAVQIPLPLKGINKYGPRSEQPELTTPDCLNVMPFDRYGRMRIGQRPGTGKLWSASIGGGSIVQMLQQTVIGTGGGTYISGGYTDTFDYSTGALDTVSSGAWNSAILGATYSGNGSNNHVASGQLRANSSVQSAAKIVPSPTLTGASYAITATIVIDAGLLANGQTMGVIYRVTGSGAERFELVLNKSAGITAVYLRYRSNTNVITNLVSGGSGFAAGSHELKVTVTGNVHQGFWDGVSIGSSTDATYSTSVDAGIVIEGNPACAMETWSLGVSTTAAVNRRSDVVAVSNGNIYMGDVGVQATLVTSGSGVLGTDTKPQGAALFAKMYLVDGNHDLVLLDITTRAVGAFTPSAGTETKTTLGRYTLAASWRGRLVLGNDIQNPQNFAMSKAGDPTNWDYTGTSPARAFAGNASTAGLIGDPITALIPASDDIFLIGGDHHLWRVLGDPADGGSINVVSDAIGVLGANAWTKSPEGIIYFVGTTGLFRVSPTGGTPELLSSHTYNQFFGAINRKSQYVTLAWDRDRLGCHIFVTPIASTGTAGTHLFFDIREGGFWPQQYPDSHGPISAAIYDGDNPTDRYVMLGGRTGFVQILSNTNRRDDSTPISCYLKLGPIQPNPPNGDAIATGMDLTVGEVFTGDVASVWNMNWSLYGDKTAYGVTDGTPRHTVNGNLATAGWQNVRLPRTRGGWFVLKFSNGNDGDYFSLERIALRFMLGGLQR